MNYSSLIIYDKTKNGGISSSCSLLSRLVYVFGRVYASALVWLFLVIGKGNAITASLVL
jgi:hypothetical protein